MFVFAIGSSNSLVSSSTLDDDGSGSKLINGRLMSLTVMTPADVPRMEIQHGCSDIKRPVISFTGLLNWELTLGI